MDFPVSTGMWPGLGQGEGGKSQARLQLWHIICGMFYLIILLKLNPSQQSPCGNLLGSV